MNSWRKKGLMGVSSILAILVIVALAGCSPNIVSEQATRVFPLTVHLYAKGESIGCDNGFMHGGKFWSIDKLAFYVSSVQIKNQLTDQWNAVELQTNAWQSKGVGLLWFNTRCGQETPQNRHLALLISHDAWINASAVRFELGVPFVLNHLNPVTQESPLNVPDMFWTWQAGHKFFRLDLMSQNHGENDAWFYHLGSVGCSSASSLRSPSKPCKTPNRFQIEVPLHTNASEFAFDIHSLLAGVQLNSETSCMFHTAQETSCDQLGQNWQNGRIFSQLQRQ